MLRVAEMLGTHPRIRGWSALVTQNVLHDRELVRTLADEAALTTTEGTLYPLLSRLRGSGWVATSWQESPTGPPRRYYALTPEGHRALAHFRTQWTAFRDAVDRIIKTGP